MNFAAWSFCVLSFGILSGCASQVITYDKTGKTMGSCKSQKQFFSSAPAHCYGYSNVDQLSFSAPQRVMNVHSKPPVTTIAINQRTYAAAPTTSVQHQAKLVQLPTSQQISLQTPPSSPTHLKDLAPQQHIKLLNETPFLP